MVGRFYSGRWCNANAEGMAGALQCAFLWTATVTWQRSRCCSSLQHLAALARGPGAVLCYGVTCAFVGPLWLLRGGEAGAARWEAGRGAERRPQRAAVAVETLPFSRHGLCHRMTPGSHERSHSPRRLGPHVRGGLRFLPPGPCGSDLHSVSHTSAPSRNVLSSSSSVALLVPQALPCCPQAWLRLACPGWLSLSSSTPIRFDLSPVVKQKAWVCLWMNQGTQRTLLLLPPGLGEWHVAAQLPRASWGRPKPVSGGRHMVHGTTRGVMLC